MDAPPDITISSAERAALCDALEKLQHSAMNRRPISLPTLLRRFDRSYYRFCKREKLLFNEYRRTCLRLQLREFYTRYQPFDPDGEIKTLLNTH